MEEFPKNQENVGENTGAEALTEMPTFEKHMEEIGKKESLGEKYYQQAEAERDRWIEMSQKKLEEAENLSSENFVIVENLREYSRSGKQKGFRLIDLKNESDVERFNDYKNNQIQKAREQVHDDEAADLDKLAKCFKNEEVIDEISKKLDSGEDFTEEELEYIGDGPESINSTFWDPEDKFMTPNLWWTINHDIIGMPDYNDLLSGDSGFPHYETIAKAQVREMKKRGRALLDDIKSE